LQNDLIPQLVTVALSRHLHKKLAFLYACRFSVLVMGGSIKLEEGVFCISIPWSFDRIPYTNP